MPTKTDTRQRILDAALELFHVQGVSATGVDQILKAAGAGKGQFYHYFQSKDDLQLQVLREFRRQLDSGEIPLISELKSWKDLERWFAFFLEQQRSVGWDRNCPIGTMAAEFSDEQADLRDEACAIFADARGVLIRFFGQMRDKGKLKRSAEPEDLADFCYAIMQGGLLVSKIERRAEPFEHAVAQALAHVKSLRA